MYVFAIYRCMYTLIYIYIYIYTYATDKQKVTRLIDLYSMPVIHPKKEGSMNANQKYDMGTFGVTKP